MPKAKFVTQMMDKLTGPAKSMASAVGNLDKKLAGITKSKAFGKIDKLGGAMTSGVKGLAVGAGAAVAAVGGLVAAVSHVSGEVDMLGKRAAKLGFPIEEMQKWGFIASQSGVSTEKFDKGLDNFARSLGDAKNGLGPLNSLLKKSAPGFLEQLKNTKNLSEAMDLYTAAMRNVKDPTVRASLAAAAFGGAGKEMVMIAANSAKSISELKKQAEENGLVTQEQADAAAKYNDAMDRLERTMKAVVVDALIPFTPALENAAKKLREFISENQIAERVGKAVGKAIQWVTEHVEEIKTWAKWVGYGLGAFLALTAVVKTVVLVMQALAIAGKVFGVLKAGFGIVVAIGKFLAVAATSIGLVPILIGAAVIGTIALIWYFRDEIGAFFVALWGYMKKAAMAVYEAMGAVGKAIIEGASAAIKWLSELPEKTWGFLTGMAAKIVSAIPELVAGAKSIGTNIIEGIVSTLSPTAIIQRVKSMGKAVISAAKDVFGIKSPSKEFAYVGRMNAEGMAQGMEQKAPVAAKASKSMSQEVVTAAQNPKVAALEVPVAVTAMPSAHQEILAQAPANTNAAPAMAPPSIDRSVTHGGNVIHLSVEFNFNGSGTTKAEAEKAADMALDALMGKLEALEVAV